MNGSPAAWLIVSAAEGYFNTDYQEPQETHHHTFHLSSLLKASVCFKLSARRSIQQRLKLRLLHRRDVGEEG